MKTLLASSFCLLIGLVGGVFVGHRDFDKQTTNEAVQLMMQGAEISDRLEAARGVRAIELIQSGDTQQLIQVFSRPVADFYTGYASLKHNDEKTKKMLGWIEQVASTNAAVAKAIHSKRQ